MPAFVVISGMVKHFWSAGHRSDSMTRYHIEGHAIVSAEGCYADADGTMPRALRFEADWLRFQAALDRAAITVMGRNGHLANPNVKSRKRLVLSRRADHFGSAPGADPNVVWCTPELTGVRAALDMHVPRGGRVGVVGGTRVFELFLGIGYDAFDLVVAARARLPGGRPVFDACPTLGALEAKLRAHGLVKGEQIAIDSDHGVSLQSYRRAGTNLGDGGSPASVLP